MHSTADTRERARIVFTWRRRVIIAALLPLLFGACVTKPPAPSTLGEPVPPPGATAGVPTAVPAPATEAEAKPPGACKPEPFCMLDCKKQDYPTMYCNLRCGC
jgi:hypothetical protein